MKKSHIPPGPWVHRTRLDNSIGTADGYAICDMAYSYSSLERYELDAAARLIEAAPDLLAALQSILAINEHSVLTEADADAIYARAAAAIAKATGDAA